MDTTQDLYHEIIIEEYRTPQNYGKLDDADLVLHGRNSSCGDVVSIYLKFDEDKQKVIEIKWEAEGCAISRAAMSVLSARIKGMSFAEVKKLTQQDIQEMLGLEGIAEGRIKCVTLGLSTLKKVKDIT